MSSSAKTVAVVGCGIGRAHIDEGYQPSSDRFRVVAICDIDATRCAAVADEFGVERRVTKFDDLLAMDDVDIIDICTPPFLHFEQITRALMAGKHVICEKPLVSSLAEIDAIADLESRSPGRVMPIFQSRFGDGVQQVKRLLDLGLGGRPYVATAETCWQRGGGYYAAPWRGKWSTELGGTLIAHGIHTHDILTYLMGPVTRLFGRTATRVNPIETEDCVSASGEFASGALLSVTGTLGSRTQFTRLYLAFENFTVESDCDPYQFYERPWRITPANDAVAAEIAGTLSGWLPVAPGFASQFRSYHDALVSGSELPVMLADARRALDFATAVYHSSRTHREETLPIGPSHPFYRGWAPAAGA